MALPIATASTRSLSVLRLPREGSRMVSITTARSSTSVIPIMIWPCSDRSCPHSIRKRDNTMVLATEIIAPTATPCCQLHPSREPTPNPSAADNRMPSGPPTMATHFTRSKSRKENSSPSEYINKMTPTSASSSNSWTSDTLGPGVNGPIRIPPNTYPRIIG